jgi:hypothetical protein
VDTSAGDHSAFGLPGQPGADRDQLFRRQGRGRGRQCRALPDGANALVDALSPLGIRHIAMPATAELLWRAIQGARS